MQDYCSSKNSLIAWECANCSTPSSGVKQRQRGYSEAEAVLGLVYNLIAGGDCLTDLEVLRGDPGTRELIGMEELIAPTTAGEHLRKFHIGAIHDLPQSQSAFATKRARSAAGQEVHD